MAFRDPQSTVNATIAGTVNTSEQTATSQANANAIAATGVKILDNQGILFDDVDNTATVTHNANVSNFRSISIAATLDGGTVGDTGAVQIQYFNADPGNPFANAREVDRYTIALAQAAIVQAPAVVAKVPVTGPYVSVTLYPPFSVGGKITASAIALTQDCPAPKVKCTMNTTGAPPVCLFDSGVSSQSSVGAGLSKSFYLPPTSGRLKVMFPGTGFPSGVYTVGLFATGGINDIFRRIMNQLSNTVNTAVQHGDQVVDVIVPWGMAMRLDLTNNDTLTRAPAMYVYDTSEL